MPFDNVKIGIIELRGTSEWDIQSILHFWLASAYSYVVPDVYFFLTSC